MTTVAACLIARNAAETLERCIASIRPHVDEVCVWENSSTDGTSELLERIAAEPGPPVRIEHGVWPDDFAAAITASFAMAAPAHRWLVYLDADEELIGGEHLRFYAGLGDELELPHFGIRFEFATQWGPSHRQEVRLVRRDLGKWEGTVCENWRESPSHREILGRIDHDIPESAMKFRHLHDDYRPLGHYLALQEAAAADPVRNPRGLYFLGYEMILGHLKYRRGVELLHRYLDGGHDRVEGDPNFFRLTALRLAALPLECTYAFYKRPLPPSPTSFWTFRADESSQTSSRTTSPAGTPTRRTSSIGG